MAIKVEEYVREDASNPYKQWFDSVPAQAAAKVTVDRDPGVDWDDKIYRETHTQDQRTISVRGM